jgi:hypothetical protein
MGVARLHHGNCAALIETFGPYSLRDVSFTEPSIAAEVPLLHICRVVSAFTEPTPKHPQRLLQGMIGTVDMAL